MWIWIETWICRTWKNCTCTCAKYTNSRLFNCINCPLFKPRNNDMRAIFNTLWPTPLLRCLFFTFSLSLLSTKYAKLLLRIERNHVAILVKSQTVNSPDFFVSYKQHLIVFHQQRTKITFQLEVVERVRKANMTVKRAFATLFFQLQKGNHNIESNRLFWFVSFLISLTCWMILYLQYE